VVRQVSSSVWNLGTQNFNFYAVEEGGRLTLIDSGMTGDWGLLQRGLKAIGHRVEDIDAVLLTHAHRDHIGGAERARTQAPADVRIHSDDEGFARSGGFAFAGGVPAEGGNPLGLGLPGVLLRLLRNAIAARTLRIEAIKELTVISDGELLDVPGRPTVSHTPGHTPGSCVFHLPERKLLFSGDALVTRNMAKARAGPQISAGFSNTDTQQARESLAVIEGLDSDVLLPGHGEPWTEGVASAVEIARAGDRRA
jgi:glyoxylase-like metal-dependent hydrolase (beta-lactamase superfamily II)